MSPKMSDQLSTLRRELKDVQRALVDLQRRLPAAAATQLDSLLEPPSRVDVERRRSLRELYSRYQTDIDSAAAGRGRLVKPKFYGSSFLVASFRGVATGVYRYIPPKSVYLTNFY